MKPTVTTKIKIGGASANSNWSSTSLLGASTSTVQAQWSLSDMRYALRSSHRYAFLKVLFTVLKYLSTTFSCFWQFGRMSGVAIFSFSKAKHVQRRSTAEVCIWVGLRAGAHSNWSSPRLLQFLFLLRLLSASTHTVQAQWSLSDMRLQSTSRDRQKQAEILNFPDLIFKNL